MVSVRANEIAMSERRMLAELARGISDRLEAEFVPVPNAGDDRVGIALREGDRNVVIELPLATIAQAAADPIGREMLRTRIKGRRDRMMFRVPPRALPKNIAPLFSPGPPRNGFRGGRR
jgi:hypothetical protein